MAGNSLANAGHITCTVDDDDESLDSSVRNVEGAVARHECTHFKPVGYLAT